MRSFLTRSVVIHSGFLNMNAKLWDTHCLFSLVGLLHSKMLQLLMKKTYLKRKSCHLWRNECGLFQMHVRLPNFKSEKKDAERYQLRIPVWSQPEIAFQFFQRNYKELNENGSLIKESLLTVLDDTIAILWFYSKDNWRSHKSVSFIAVNEA